VVAGLDDRYTEQDDLDAALAGRPAGVTTLLLAHDPVVGEDAARRGIELVLSGHTHGGQFGLPWLGRHVNLSLVTRQPRGGLRERDGCYQHVTAGLGTTGPPLRLGVAPEIALVRLRSAQRRAAG
jgi:predicted MPP superfamily phosphohydrolase